MRPRALIAEDEPALRAGVRRAVERLWPGPEVCAEVGDGLEAVPSEMSCFPGRRDGTISAR
jgi:hypothetical protein